MVGVNASKAGVNNYAGLLICAHLGRMFFKDRIVQAPSLLKGRWLFAQYVSFDGCLFFVVLKDLSLSDWHMFTFRANAY